MTTPQHSLAPLDAARLRAADGLAAPEELAALRAAGVDPEALVAERQVLSAALRAPPHADLASGALASAVLAELGLTEPAPAAPSVRAALHQGAGPQIDVADDVLRALELSDPALGPVLRAALRGAEAAPDVSAAVLAAVQPGAAPLAGPAGAVGQSLRAAAGASPEVAGSTLAALDLDEAGGLGALLRGEAGEAPDLADAVLQRAGLSEVHTPVGSALRDAAGAAPDVAGDVLAALQADEPDLGAALRDAAGSPPDVAGGVLAALGLDEPAPEVGDALRTAAGPAPDLGGRVQEVVQPAPASLPPAALPPAALAPAANQRRPGWPVWSGIAAAGVALAAAALLFVTPGTTNSLAPVSYELAAVNEVEIEDLTIGEEAMVQVLQFEEDAPTIIFVDVLDDDLPVDEGEGATL